MKIVVYKCNHCKKEIESARMVTFGSSDEESFNMNNTLPDRHMIQMNAHSNIHFCSKTCFVDFFFHPEGFIHDVIADV